MRKYKFPQIQLKSENFGKVRNDSHYTEEYRCATHSICNLKYNVPEKGTKLFIIYPTMIMIL